MFRFYFVGPVGSRGLWQATQADRVAPIPALVSLELAILELAEGRTKAVRSLAGEMLWIFSAQGVHGEALAALRLFCQVAEAETATPALARSVVAYLEQARHDPLLRFEVENGVSALLT